MLELYKLVVRFLVSEIDYDAFRESMETLFLSRRSGNASLDAAALRIDVVCAEFSQGLIARKDMRTYFLVALESDIPGAHVGSGANIRVGQIPTQRVEGAAEESSAIVQLAPAA